MKRLIVDDLTLSEIKVLVLKKFQFEKEQAYKMNQGINQALGVESNSQPEVMERALNIMVEKCTDIIAERLVYKDPSPLDLEDMNVLMPTFMDLMGDSIPREMIEKIMSMVFGSIIEMTKADAEPYMGYMEWLQTYLDIAFETGADPKDLNLDQTIYDQITRTTTPKEKYIEKSEKTIAIATDIDTQMKMTVGPMIDLLVGGSDVSEEEKAEITKQMEDEVRPELEKKLFSLEEYLRKTLDEEVARIYG